MEKKQLERRGGPRQGSGRKPKSPDEKQSQRIVAMLTPSEAEALTDAAGDEPIGTYLRRLIIRHLSRQKT